MFFRYLIVTFLFISVYAKGLTVKTIAHGNWENPAIWSIQAVPTTPDTIIVSNYVVVNQNFTIYSPTVLIIDSTGTICGNYLMVINCGANFINYGFIYLNQIQTSAGLNYHIIQCKTSITLFACSTSNGFHTLPPKGYVAVWPPVFCQTINTNWEGGTITNVTEVENTRLKIYPNPLNGSTLNVSAFNATVFKLTDVMGNLIKTGYFTDNTSINLSNLPNGIYFLELEIDGKTQTKKIMKL